MMRLFSRKISSEKKVLIGGLVLAVIVTCLYFSTMSTNPVNYADSDDLTMAAFSGGLAHPPGYPFYVLVNNVFISFFDNFDSLVVMNFVNTATGIGTVVAFYYLLISYLKYTNKVNSWTVACTFISTLWFATSWYIWNHSVVVEVFMAEILLLNL